MPEPDALPQDRPFSQPGLREMAAVAAVLLLAAGLLFLSAPRDGEFWWSDAPRHALNGAFVKDLVAAHPWADPAGWAMQYYVKYPALTILFYPPLFYFVLAPFYALFGVSHATALGVVLLHYFAFALGLSLLARRWLAAPLAALVGLAAMAAPGLALWGRQVMLEVPTLAYAVWGMLLLRRYAGTGRKRPLYLGAFLLLCALYTKLNTVFLVPVAALMLFAGRGRLLWQDRHVWIAAALGVLGLLPLVMLTLRFGAANVQSVAGIADAAVPRGSIAGWIWYARQLPATLGWPLLLGAALWPAAVLLRRAGQPRLARADVVLLLGWLGLGYLFFSAIALKEARFVTQFMPPLLLAAGLGLARLLPARAATLIAALLVAATAWHTGRAAPVPEVAGYREAASWIAKAAPPDAVVVFSGKRDGSFIFNLRTLPRHDITTLRADKLLLEVAVRRELGVTQRDLSEADIAALLDRLGVRYVVAQPDFWTDLAEMARLQAVLHSDQFREVARIPLTANVPVEDHELRIYENLHKPPPSGAEITLDLPIIGRSLHGRTATP